MTGWRRRILAFGALAAVHFVVSGGPWALPLLADHRHVDIPVNKYVQLSGRGDCWPDAGLWPETHPYWCTDQGQLAFDTLWSPVLALAPVWRAIDEWWFPKFLYQPEKDPPWLVAGHIFAALVWALVLYGSWSGIQALWRRRWGT